MAKYEDYVKRQQGDALEGEINEAGEQSNQRQGELPERFRNKSREEIAESFVQLEEKFNSRNDTIGSLRRQVDELVALETVRQAQPVQEEEVTPVTVDDIYENPEEAISKVVERTSSKKIEDLERQVAQSNQALALREFESKHPGWREDAMSEEFQAWVNASGYRQRLREQADKYDFDAANDLFEMYYDSQSGSDGNHGSAEEAARREKQLQDAELESGGAEAYDLEPKFSRQDIIQKKIEAHRGDAEAISWIKANQDAIAIAYETGNIVD